MCANNQNEPIQPPQPLVDRNGNFVGYDTPMGRRMLVKKEMASTAQPTSDPAAQREAAAAPAAPTTRRRSKNQTKPNHKENQAMKTKITPRLGAGRPLTKREREELMKREREAAVMNEEGIVIACARRNDVRIRLLFGKLARKADRVRVLDEFVEFFDDGSVHRVRIPASFSFESVVGKIASACKVRKGSACSMRSAILETLGRGDILVVDALHNARPASLMGMQVAGFLREIHDVTGCAVVATYLQPYSPEEQFARRITFTTRRANLAAAK